MIHTKRPTFSPLPLEGAGERSETGLAPTFVEIRFPRTVIPSAAEGSLLYSLHRSLRLSICLKHPEP